MSCGIPQDKKNLRDVSFADTIRSITFIILKNVNDLFFRCVNIFLMTQKGQPVKFMSSILAGVTVFGKGDMMNSHLDPLMSDISET